MTKRIPVRKGPKKPKKHFLDKHKPFLSDLTKVTMGKELRGVAVCYHVSPIHPGIVSKLNISGMHNAGKPWIIDKVRQGCIYVWIKPGLST